MKITAKQWRSIQLLSWAAPLVGSLLIAYWSLADIDIDRLIAQTTAGVIVVGVVLSQIADTMRDRAWHQERCEEVHRRWAERDLTD